MVRSRSLSKWFEALSHPHCFSLCSFTRCTVYAALNPLMRWCNEQTLQQHKAHDNIHTFYWPDGSRDVFCTLFFVRINIFRKNLQKCPEVSKKSGTHNLKHTKMIWPTACVFNLVLCMDLLDFVEKVLSSFAPSDKVLAYWMFLLDPHLLCGYWLLATLEATRDLQATCSFWSLCSADLHCLEVKCLWPQYFCAVNICISMYYNLAAPWNKSSDNSSPNDVLD